MNAPIQYRKVNHEGGYYLINMLRPGEWALPTAVGPLWFCQSYKSKRWAPVWGTAVLDEYATTRLDSCVKRVMFKARAAYAVAAALRTLGGQS